MSIYKKFTFLGLFIFLVAVIICFGANYWVVNSTKDKIYSSLDQLPSNHVGLLLGTSKKYKSGKENMFFKHRIEAAAKLYHTRKIRHIIVSGDNRTIYYNEPVDMKKALLKAGVPDSVITLDYAGFRTLDSVIRCKKVFGQNNVTIISQQFHTFRALFIGQSYGLDAVGFIAEDVEGNKAYKVLIREVFARVKAVLDVHVFHLQPKFLGNSIVISVA